MNIGLDIDGCLTNIEKFQFQYGVPYFEKKYQLSVVNENGKSIRQLFDCSKLQEARFWLRYCIKYNVKDPVREGAAEFTKWAYENGHQVYIITSRALTAHKYNPLGMLMRRIVKSWLKKSGIRYEAITFCDEDKLPALEKHNVSYMVEDDPDNIMAMQDKTKVICFDAKCNAHLKDEVACRCSSFEEILDFVIKECEHAVEQIQGYSMQMRA